VSARLSKAVCSSDKNNRGQLILASSGGKAISSPSRGYTKSTPSGGGSFKLYPQRMRWFKAGGGEATAHDLRPVLRLACGRTGGPSASTFWIAVWRDPVSERHRHRNVM